MNMHGFLASNHIEYGSPESLEFTDVYFMLLNYWTLVESNKLSQETGEVFHNFEKSKYANGEYFNQYLQNIDGYDRHDPTKYVFEYDKIKELFDGIYIPTIEDWNKLKDSVAKHGLKNAFRLAVAP